jgi:hypothetical protein
MSLRNFIIANGAPGSEQTHFGVGRLYPMPLEAGTYGANLCSFVDGSTLFLNVAMPRPRVTEIQGFREPLQFRIYEGQDMPGGLLLMHMTHDPKEMGCIFECPFDVVKQLRHDPESLDGFFTHKRISILATLTDSSHRPRVVAMRLLELPPLVVKRLRVLWKGQLRAPNYEVRYNSLASRKSIKQLWTKAKKY